MKMINGKPCMKCGGKVKYKGGGKYPKMVGGGTPPNCEPGYIAVGNKCIPSTLNASVNPPNLSTSNPSSTNPLSKDFTILTNKPDPNNPFQIKKEGPIWQNCDPGYKFDFIQNKCVPDPNSTVTLPKYENKDGNWTQTGTFTIPKPGSPFKQSIGGCPDGQQKNIVTGKCEPIVKSEGVKCKPGFILDPRTNKCVRDVKIPANVVLEGANTWLNSISRFVASNRDFNNYYDQQVARMNLRQPIPDWATNEQKQVPAYTPYVKKGGLIKMQRAGSFCTKGTGCSNSSTIDDPIRNRRVKVEREPTVWESLTSWPNEEIRNQYKGEPNRLAAISMETRYKNLMNPKNQYVDEQGNWLSSDKRGEGYNFYTLMRGLEGSGIYSPNNPSNIDNLVEWISQNEVDDLGNKTISFKDNINKNYFTGLAIPNKVARYFKEGGTNMNRSITTQTTEPLFNQNFGIPFHDPNRLYKEAAKLSSRYSYSPVRASQADMNEMLMQSLLKERLHEIQNPNWMYDRKTGNFTKQNLGNIPTGYMIQSQDGQMPYIKKVGGSTNNKTNNMINIKKENRGKFTAQAKRAGMGVQEFADYVLGNPDKFTTSTVKRANFAKNAAGWKKEYGGMTMNNPYYSYYQDGGPMPMQDGQQPMMGGEGGGDQMQQIIMMIVEALQEGMSPQDILAALVKMGIPQDQATQLLQAVIEQMQGGGGQPMQGQEMEEGEEYEEEEGEEEEEGMGQQAAPMMAYGGKTMPRNEGFQALPQYVQEKIMRNMQGGGQMNEQMNMLIKAYAQIKGISPQEVMKMLQQQLQSVSPQQQDQALQSIMQNMQMEIKQAQEGAQAGQMQQEQGMMRMGGMNSNYYNR